MSDASSFLCQSDLARLVEDYSHVWQIEGKDEVESTRITIDFIHRAATEALKRGILYEPANVGDRLLLDAQSNRNVKNFVDVRKADGVRDDDIRTWWNQPPIERLLREQIHEHRLFSTFLSELKAGKSEEEAGVHVRRAQPMFGEPTIGDDENRPLPIELIERAAMFAFESRRPNADSAHVDSDTLTFNAKVRRACRAGLLR